MKDQSADYIRGYKDGFGEGWDAAKETLRAKPVKDYTFHEGCVVCGIGKNGEPLGYACQHPDCPTRITC